MSGILPLQFKPTPNVGTVYDPTVQIQAAAQTLQLKQQQDAVQRQNALMGIFQDPKSLDGTGNPTPETMQKIMSVDPQVGMQVRQNMLIGQERQLRTQALSSGLMEKKMDMIGEATAPILETYETEVKNGIPEEQARRNAQAALVQANERLKTSGIFTEDDYKRFPQQFDPTQMRNVVAGTKQYQDWLKQQREDKKQTRLEKHDEDVNYNKGTSLLHDEQGNPVTYRPNAPPGQQFIGADGKPLSPDKVKNLTKIAAGSGSPAAERQRDDDTIAAYERGVEHTPEQTEAYQAAIARRKAQADRAATVAGARQQATGKPYDILIDGKPGTGFRHHEKWWDSNGNEITGDVRLASGARADRREAFREADHLAIKDDVEREHPDWTPGQVATEAKSREKQAATLPGSVAADRAAIAADVAADPNFQGKPAGIRAAEVEHRFQVARTATMDPEVARNLAKQYVATGNVNVFSGFRRNTQMMNQIEKAVIEEQNRLGKTPEEIARSSADFAAYTQGIRAFEAGGKLEPVVRSQNVAVQHLSVLQESADALNNGDVRLFNSLKNRVAQETGSSAPTDFEGVKRIVGTELVKAITGSAGALGDREALDADLKTANSPKQLKDLINRYKQLMVGQLSGLRQSYDRLETGKSFDERFLAPVTQKEMERFSPGAQSVQVPDALKAARDAGHLYSNADGTVIFNKDNGKYYDKAGKEIPAPGAAKPAETPKPAETKPLPLRQGMKESDLEDGKVYDTARGPATWNSATKRFMPVKGQ